MSDPRSPPPLDASDLSALVAQVEQYALFLVDLTGRVASWNRGAEMIVGCAADSIVGRHFSILYPPEDVALGKPEQDLERALQAGTFQEVAPRARADGSTFWAQLSISVLRDATGRPKAFAKVLSDLTEQRTIEEALRRTEERFRLLVEGVTDYAIYMLDPRGLVTTWNSGAQKIKGYDAASIVGRDFAVFFTPEDRAAGKPLAELETARTEGRFAEEGWRLREDGTRFWASVVVTALRDQSGALLGFSKITRDLTQRKLAEDNERELREQQTARLVAEAAELRASQEREKFELLSRQLDVILEGVVDGITVQDRRGAVIFANTAAAKLTGLSGRDDFVTSDPQAVTARFEVLDEHGHRVPTQDLPGRRVLAGAAQASALLEVSNRETGQHWWLRVRSNGILGADGRTELAVNILHDFTQQRRQDEQERCLKEVTTALSESLDFRTTLEAVVGLLAPGLADWCAIHLLEGKTLVLTALAHADPRRKRRAEELDQRFPPNRDQEGGVWEVLTTRSPLLYEQVTDALLRAWATSAEHLEALRESAPRSAIIAPIDTRGRVAGTLSLTSARSGRRYDARDLALVVELGRRIGAFVENALLFERARAAAESAAAAVQEAQAAARMKDDFLATVSHELRTPLNAILGWASLLKKRSDPASVSRGVEVIHRNAAAQSKLIEDILDVSRIITGKLRLELRPIDLTTIVSDAIEVVRPSAAAQAIRIEFEHPSVAVPIVGDPGRLQQVLWNLLSNAVKFGNPGGYVRVALEAEAEHCIVSVTDDGRGIDLDFLPYVFDRFKQADSSTTRRFGGLGLGLSIVRHIVELHGGKAAVTSAGPGKGASFRILLPARATVAVFDAPSDAAAPPERAPGHDGSGKLTGVKVLLVDDEADALDLLELVLQQAGAEVRKASSASAGFLLLQGFEPHVIVSDVAMPEEDGYTFIRRVRSAEGRVARTPAIALTAYTRNEDRMRALAMGFDTHLGKPVNAEELKLVIERMARGHG